MKRIGRLLALATCSLALSASLSWAQTPAPTPRQDANQAIVEGLELYQQGTATAYQQAIDRWQEAVQLLQQAGDRPTALSILLNIGQAQQQLADLDDALTTYENALPLVEASGDDGLLARTLSQLARIRALRGEFQTALDLYDRALPLWNRVDYQTGTAETLNAIGFVRSELGEYPEAADAFQAALNLTESLGIPRNTAATSNNLAGAYLDLNRFDDAEALYQRALSIWREVGDRPGEASTLNNLGDLHQRRGDLDSALREFAAALNIWRSAHNQRAEASTLQNIGDVYFQVGNLTTALEFYDRALPLRQRSRDLPGLARTHYSRARIYRQQNQLDRAQTEIETTLNLVEDLRNNIASDESRARFFATQQDYYEFFIDLLMQRHRQNPRSGFDAEALYIKERASARSLLDLLNSLGTPIQRGLDPQLGDRADLLRQQLHLLEQQRVEVFNREHTDAEAAELDRAFETTLAEYREVQAEIRAVNPEYANLTQPQPVRVNTLQQQLLDADTTLLAYSLGGDRSFLWVVTPKQFRSYELPPRSQLETLANDYLQTIYIPRLRSRPDRVNAATQALTEAVLPFSRDELRGQRLVIVGDGVLQYVPFAALAKAEETPLIAEFEVVNLPSASTLAALRAFDPSPSPSQEALAILADPVFGLNDERLPNFVAQPQFPPELERSARQSEVLFSRLSFTQTEAEGISALFPESQQWNAYGFAASRDAVMGDRLADYQIVHFATHGLANSVNPELSGLVLSLFDENGRPQNGFLRLYDIFNLKLSAQLVVLSACNTGRGREMRGEGIVGLTRGFMYAGVDRVVVSFWSVDDEGTAVLMQRFYHHMLTEKLSPSAALRAAQLELLQDDRWNLPYYWAAFSLQGDWRTQGWGLAG